MTTTFPIAGNQWFAKVSNTDLDATTLLHGVEAVVTALEVPTSTGALPVVTPVGADIALSDAQLQSLVNPGFLLMDLDGLTAARSLTFGADTSARALALKQLLGLTEGVKARLLTFKQISGPAAAFALSIGNTSATSTNVKFSLNGGAVADTQVLAVSTADDDAYVVVSSTAPTTAGQEAILFNIVHQAQA